MLTRQSRLATTVTERTEQRSSDKGGSDVEAARGGERGDAKAPRTGARRRY